ncbi:hypothetical protein ADUPG1_013993, partial [Aduncisulcus paluster]
LMPHNLALLIYGIVSQYESLHNVCCMLLFHALQHSPDYLPIIHRFGVFECLIYRVLRFGFTESTNTLLRHICLKQQSCVVVDSSSNSATEGPDMWKCERKDIPNYMAFFLPPSLAEEVAATGCAQLGSLAHHHTETPEFVWNKLMYDSLMSQLESAVNPLLEVAKEKGKAEYFMTIVRNKVKGVDTSKKGLLSSGFKKIFGSRGEAGDSVAASLSASTVTVTERHLGVVLSHPETYFTEVSPSVNAFPPYPVNYGAFGAQFSLGGVFIDVFNKNPATKLKNTSSFISSVNRFIAYCARTIVDDHASKGSLPQTLTQQLMHQLIYSPYGIGAGNSATGMTMTGLTGVTEGADPSASKSSSVGRSTVSTTTTTECQDYLLPEAREVSVFERYGSVVRLECVIDTLTHLFTHDSHKNDAGLGSFKCYGALIALLMCAWEERLIAYSDGKTGRPSTSPMSSELTTTFTSKILDLLLHTMTPPKNDDSRLDNVNTATTSFVFEVMCIPSTSPMSSELTTTFTSKILDLLLHTMTPPKNDDSRLDNVNTATTSFVFEVMCMYLSNIDVKVGVWGAGAFSDAGIVCQIMMKCLNGTYFTLKESERRFDILKRDFASFSSLSCVAPLTCTHGHLLPLYVTRISQLLLSSLNDHASRSCANSAIRVLGEIIRHSVGRDNMRRILEGKAALLSDPSDHHHSGTSSSSTTFDPSSLPALFFMRGGLVGMIGHMCGVIEGELECESVCELICVCTMEMCSNARVWCKNVMGEALRLALVDSVLENAKNKSRGDSSSFLSVFNTPSAIVMPRLIFTPEMRKELRSCLQVNQAHVKGLIADGVFNYEEAHSEDAELQWDVREAIKGIKCAFVRTKKEVYISPYYLTPLLEQLDKQRKARDSGSEIRKEDDESFVELTADEVGSLIKGVCINSSRMVSPMSPLGREERELVWEVRRQMDVSSLASLSPPSISEDYQHKLNEYDNLSNLFSQIVLHCIDAHRDVVEQTIKRTPQIEQILTSGRADVDRSDSVDERNKEAATNAMKSVCSVGTPIRMYNHILKLFLSLSECRVVDEMICTCLDVILKRSVMICITLCHIYRINPAQVYEDMRAKGLAKRKKGDEIADTHQPLCFPKPLPNDHFSRVLASVFDSKGSMLTTFDPSVAVSPNDALLAVRLSLELFARVIREGCSSAEDMCVKRGGITAVSLCVFMSHYLNEFIASSDTSDETPTVSPEDLRKKAEEEELDGMLMDELEEDVPTKSPSSPPVAKKSPVTSVRPSPLLLPSLVSAHLVNACCVYGCVSLAEACRCVSHDDKITKQAIGKLLYDSYLKLIVGNAKKAMDLERSKRKNDSELHGKNWVEIVTISNPSAESALNSFMGNRSGKILVKIGQHAYSKFASSKVNANVVWDEGQRCDSFNFLLGEELLKSLWESMGWIGKSGSRGPGSSSYLPPFPFTSFKGVPHNSSVHLLKVCKVFVSTMLADASAKERFLGALDEDAMLKESADEEEVEIDVNHEQMLNDLCTLIPKMTQLLRKQVNMSLRDTLPLSLVAFKLTSALRCVCWILRVRSGLVTSSTVDELRKVMLRMLTQVSTLGVMGRIIKNKMKEEEKTEASREAGAWEKLGFYEQFYESIFRSAWGVSEKVSDIRFLHSPDPMPLFDMVIRVGIVALNRCYQTDVEDGMDIVEVLNLCQLCAMGWGEPEKEDLRGTERDGLASIITSISRKKKNKTMLAKSGGLLWLVVALLLFAHPGTSLSKDSESRVFFGTAMTHVSSALSVALTYKTNRELYKSMFGASCSSFTAASVIETATKLEFERVKRLVLWVRDWYQQHVGREEEYAESGEQDSMWDVKMWCGKIGGYVEEEDKASATPVSTPTPPKEEEKEEEKKE